jgi:transposase
MKIDGRTLTHDASESIRIMACRRVREGEKPSDVIKSYGLCRTTIYRWLRAEGEGGEEALKSTKGTGRKPLLTDKQKQRVRSWICGKDPRQYGFDFGLWTRQVVASLIKEKMNKDVSVTTVGRILAELDITPQKPLRRAYERDPEAIRQWKQETFPHIRKRAAQCGANIFFLDEAGVRSDAPLGRTWGEKGKKSVVKTSGQRQSVNAISAVNSQGAFWYNVYTGRLNATTFIAFLKQFMRNRRKPVFLVLDKHPSHRATCVAQYVQSLQGRLELHFLPGYAPELNPDEFVWNYIRETGTCKKPLRKNESLRQRVNSDLVAIKQDRTLVKSFFYAESVAYILH